MGNICSLAMKVRGKKEDLEKFLKWLTQDADTYIGRGIVVDLEEEKELFPDGTEARFIIGWTKNSIVSSMVHDAVDMREHPEVWSWTGSKKPERTVTIWEACKELQVDCEAWSEEPGCCFQEHYLFRNGALEKDESAEWFEIYPEYYSSKEEAELKYRTDISDSDWEAGDPISIGGFSNYMEFEI